MKLFRQCVISITMALVAYGEDYNAESPVNDLTGHLQGLWTSISPPSKGVKIEVKKAGALYKSILIIRQRQEVIAFVPKLNYTKGFFQLEIAQLNLSKEHKKKCGKIYDLALSLKAVKKKSDVLDGETYLLRIGAKSVIPSSPFAKDTKHYITWNVASNSEKSRAEIVALVSSLPIDYFNKGEMKGGSP